MVFSLVSTDMLIVHTPLSDVTKLHGVTFLFLLLLSFHLHFTIESLFFSPVRQTYTYSSSVDPVCDASTRNDHAELSNGDDDLLHRPMKILTDANPSVGDDHHLHFPTSLLVVTF